MMANCLMAWTIASVIALLISIVSGSPRIVSEGTEVRAYSGQTIVLPCHVEDPGDHKIEWWYLNHNQQISVNDVITVTTDGRYAVLQPQGGSGIMKNLQITRVKQTDDGHYQCRIAGTDQTVTSALVILDKLVSTPSPAYLPPINFTDCCVTKGVSAACRPLCSPSSVNLEDFNIMNCADDLRSLVACGSDGHNHVPCCRQRLVSSLCLGFCQNTLPDDLTLQSHGTCLLSAKDVIACYEQGHHLLPSPPRRFYVQAGSTSALHAGWAPPAGNLDTVTGYKLFYKPTSQIHYSSTPPLQRSQYDYFFSDLQPDTLYSLYVISLNEHGASQPSARVQAKTNPRNSLPPGINRETVEECCEYRHVRPACQPVLCGDSPLQANVTMMDCFSDLDAVFQCMSGERNHTECCRQQQIDPVCYPLCSGQVTGLLQHQYHCIDLLPQISTCFNDGAENIPSAPREFLVESMSATSALLKWSAPQENADLVVTYHVRYWATYQPDTRREITVEKNVHTLLITNLSPDSQYTAEVMAEGRWGSSIPSPSLLLITWQPPDDLGAIPVPSPSAPHNETACCIEDGVSSGCLPLCSYKTYPSAIDKVMSCVGDIGKIFSCATDGRNHTSCCAERFVPAGCRRFCELSQQEAQDYAFLPGDMACVSYVDNIIACLAEGVVSLPSPPQEVTVTMTTQSITVTWRPPTFVPNMSPLSYEVRWRSSPDGAWNMESVETTSYPILNLRPQREYDIRVTAVTQQGRSLPAPRLTARTLSDSRDTFPLPKDVSECCMEKSVHHSCQPACSGSEVVDLNACSGDLKKILECAADGRNHTSCCQRRNLPAQCLHFCHGAPRADSLLEMLCVTFTDQILTCFREGYDHLPGPPTRFLARSVTPTSVTLTWGSPDLNPEGVKYELYYRGAYGVSQYRTVVDVRSPYTLTPLQPINTYTVYLVAYNEQGSSLPTNKIQFVTITTEAPVIDISQNPPGRYVKAGSTVVLECHARGQPSPTVTWLRDGMNATDVTLVLHQVSPADNGRYTCTAENGGEPVIRNVFLHVQSAPNVTVPRPSLMVLPGISQTAFLTCDIRGYPDTVQWSRDGVTLSDAARYMRRLEVQEELGLIRAHFDISAVVEGDYGVYTCRASNSFGHHDAQITLKDPRLPEIPSDLTPAPKVVNVTSCCIQQGVRDKCHPICTFDIDIERLFTMSAQDQTDCLADGDKILACAADGRNHTGCCHGKMPDYCLPFCLGIVDRPLSSNQSRCLFYMEEIIGCMEEGHAILPTPPRNLRGRPINGFIEVWWDAPSTNMGAVEWYDITYQASSWDAPQNASVGPTQYQYNVTSVHSHSTYTLTVSARNHYGTSHSSNKITIETYEMVPSAATQIRGTYVGQGQVNLFWEAPVRYSGAVISYNVYYAVMHGHAHPHYNKVNTHSANPHYLLVNLAGLTNYSIYITAVSSHFESKPSEIFTLRTGENLPPMPGKVSKPASNPFVIPIVSVFVVLFIVMGTGLFVYWYFRIRRIPHNRFKDSVSFENPGYANVTGDENREPRAWITDLSSEAVMTPSSDLPSQKPITDAADGLGEVQTHRGGGSGSHADGDFVTPTRGVTGSPPSSADSSIMKEVDSNSDQGYSTLSHMKGDQAGSCATLEVGQVDLSDGSAAVQLDFNSSASVM